MSSVKNSKKNCWIIPFGGNGFTTRSGESSDSGTITPFGIGPTWTSTSTTISLFFHSQFPGKVLAALRLSVPQGSSRISISFSQENRKALEEEREIGVNGSDLQLVNCGMFTIESPGYVRVDIKGLEKTGPSFAAISHLLLVSETHPLLEEMKLRFVEDPGDFYFGRRGPSVHLRYLLPEEVDTEYFYNEIYVPPGQDVIGAYFCAMGFTGGYFGIQVNSSTERRVLFSIWSEYNSDNPAEIPEDYKVTLIRKGEDVYVGEFGNEGSGAQSYLRYMWEPGTSYRFIVQAVPIDEERTMYTAWFSPGSNQWMLIASFDKPKVSTFFRGPYSFSENFIPEQGYIERHCLFANQWSYDKNGNWTEITRAQFTADATSSKETRMDVSGGVGIDGDPKRFYLKNCGFFNDRIVPGTYFDREKSGQLPPVDVSLLP